MNYIDYISMLDRIEWNFSKGDRELGILDRILFRIKNSILEDNQKEVAENTYSEFWKYIVNGNVYMSVLFFKKVEKIYDKSDLCIQKGLAVISEELKKRIIEDVIMWRLLAEIEMNVSFHIIEYTRYAVDNGILRRTLKYMQYSNDLCNNIIFFLHFIVTSVSDTQLRRNVIVDINSQNWVIDVSIVNNKNLIFEIIELLKISNDIASLINIFDLCADLKISEFSNNSLMEWKEYLLTQYQPVSMILYRKILRREGFTSNDIINEIYCFTSWKMGNPVYNINNYLLFTYAIREYPEAYDFYSNYFNKSIEDFSCLNTDEILSYNIEMDDLWDMIGESSKRYLNHLLVDKPFRTLILHNPDKVLDFLRIIGPLSLYHHSKSNQYKKSLTWIETRENYFNAY